MNLYVFNKSRAPFYHGPVTIPAQGYGVLPKETADDLASHCSDIRAEGHEGFTPIWVTNIPERTPNQIT